MYNVLDDVYYLEQFIEEGKHSDIIQYENLLLYEKTKYGLLGSYNIFNDYLEDIRSVAKTVVLSNTELIKYRYKPRLLCYDLYKCQDLYYILLLLNNICDVKDFNMKKIKVIRPKDMNYVLTSIYNSEYNYLESNKSTVQNKQL